MVHQASLHPWVPYFKSRNIYPDTGASLCAFRYTLFSSRVHRWGSQWPTYLWTELHFNSYCRSSLPSIRMEDHVFLGIDHLPMPTYDTGLCLPEFQEDLDLQTLPKPFRSAFFESYTSLDNFPQIIRLFEKPASSIRASFCHPTNCNTSSCVLNDCWATMP